VIVHLLLITVVPALLVWAQPTRLLHDAGGPVIAARIDQLRRGRPLRTLVSPRVTVPLYAPLCHVLRFVILAIRMGPDTLVGIVLMMTSTALAPAYAASRDWGPPAVVEQSMAGAITWFAGDSIDLDDDEAALAAYNARLAGLNRRRLDEPRR
jgi:putative membrane protein